jgi:hypothetical protein
MVDLVVGGCVDAEAPRLTKGVGEVVISFGVGRIKTRRRR